MQACVCVLNIPYYYTLNVQGAQIKGMQGFYERNREYGVGQIPHMWLIGPWGIEGQRCDVRRCQARYSQLAI